MKITRRTPIGPFYLGSAEHFDITLPGGNQINMSTLTEGHLVKEYVEFDIGPFELGVNNGGMLVGFIVEKQYFDHQLAMDLEDATQG